MKLTYKICSHFLIVEQIDLLACYGLRCVQKHCPILLEDTDKVSQDESHVSLPLINNNSAMFYNHTMFLL